MAKYDSAYFKKQNGKYNAAMLTMKYINANDELHAELSEFANNNGLSMEMGPARLIYHYLNNVLEIPKCGCGCELKFKNITDGYSQYCSRKCQGKSEKVKSKRQSSVMKKYGVSHVFKSQQVIEKSRQTTLENYGVENASASEEIKKRKVQTCRSNHGVDHPMQSKEVRKKSANTMLEKYGSETPWKNEEFKRAKYAEWIETFGMMPAWKQSARDKRKTTRDGVYADKMQSMGITIIEINDKKVKAKCEKCGNEYEIDKYVMYQRLIVYNTNPCTECNPISSKTSASEIEVLDFVRSIYGGEIESNVRIGGMELDVYLPKLKIAIEYDGLYWHSNEYRSKDYHLEKTVKCNRVGIRLIHIFEDEWKYKRSIVESIISNAIGISSKKIYARKCEIRHITDREYETFVMTNHIQGYAPASTRIALEHEGNIVSVMSFSKRRGIYRRKSAYDGTEYEMIRYCTALNTTIVGGAAKLLSHFVIGVSNCAITTYADKRYFTGETYLKLGFEKDGDTPPNYWYIFGNNRSHRFNHRKSVLVKNGADPKKTEHEIMAEKNIKHIYDCGNTRYSLRINNKNAVQK